MKLHHKHVVDNGIQRQDNIHVTLTLVVSHVLYPFRFRDLIMYRINLHLPLASGGFPEFTTCEPWKTLSLATTNVPIREQGGGVSPRL
jgi:hypothetical protein